MDPTINPDDQQRSATTLRAATPGQEGADDFGISGQAAADHLRMPSSPSSNLGGTPGQQVERISCPQQGKQQYTELDGLSHLSTSISWPRLNDSTSATKLQQQNRLRGDIGRPSSEPLRNLGDVLKGIPPQQDIPSLERKEGIVTVPRRRTASVAALSDEREARGSFEFQQSRQEVMNQKADSSHVKNSHEDFSSVRGSPMGFPVKTRKARGGVFVTFPEKLHRMLEEAEERGFADIVGWQPDGRSFRIHKRARFVSEVLPKYFNQSQYASFRRQLNLYSFQRVQGKGKGTYFHENCQRGCAQLCAYIPRIAQGDREVSETYNPATVPPPPQYNFSDMAQVPGTNKSVASVGEIPFNTSEDAFSRDVNMAVAVADQAEWKLASSTCLQKQQSTPITKSSFGAFSPISTDVGTFQEDDSTQEYHVRNRGQGRPSAHHFPMHDMLHGSGKPPPCTGTTENIFITSSDQTNEKQPREASPHALPLPSFYTTSSQGPDREVSDQKPCSVDERFWMQDSPDAPTVLEHGDDRQHYVRADIEMWTSLPAKEPEARLAPQESSSGNSS